MGEVDRGKGVEYPTVLGEVNFFVGKPLFFAAFLAWKKINLFSFCRVILFFRMILYRRRRGNRARLQRSTLGL